LDWKELQAARPEFHVSDFDAWRQRLRRDPWRGMLESRQRLTREMLVAIAVKIGER